MKRYMSTALAVTMSAVLLLTGCGTAAYAEDTDQEPETVSEEDKTGAELKEESSAEASGDEKQQNVYVLSYAVGMVEKVYENGAEIEASELPVKEKVTYMLDGREISADELKGKNGHVVIRYEFESLQKETVELDGERAEMAVPFAVMTCLILPEEHFSNVSVTNGRMYQDGSRTIAGGLLLPGLSEDLQLDSLSLDALKSEDKADSDSEETAEEDIRLPSELEIEADAKDFELGLSLSVVTDDAFGKMDLPKILDGMEGDEKLDELESGMSQLLDGSQKLYEGLDTLFNKAAELSAGVSALNDGASALAGGAETLSGGGKNLQDGAAKVNAGASELLNGAGSLSEGAKTLSGGLQEISAQSDTLRSGAMQVFAALLQTAQDQITASGIEIPALTADNYEAVLNGVIASLDQDAVYQQALNAVTEEVSKNRGIVEEKVTEAVKAGVEEKVSAAVKAEVSGKVQKAAAAEAEEAITEAVQAEVQSQVAEAVKAQVSDEAQAEALIGKQTEAKMQSEEIKAQIASLKEEKMQSAEMQALISEKTEEQMQSAEVQAAIAQNTEEQMQSDEVQAVISQQTETQIQKLIADNMAGDEVQSKLSAASAGVQKLASLKASLDSYRAFYNGLCSYSAGVDQCSAGAASLLDGANKLNAGAGTLLSGTSDLSDGASKLSAGIDSLAEGAKKLSDGTSELNSHMPELLSGTEKLRNGSKDLHEGIEKLDEEGIEKLRSFVDGDVSGLMKRIRMTKLAADAESGQHAHSYIYRTAEID